ncbi:MAG: hypothetical protein QXY18_00950 [Nitrososphaerota archaeon]
MEINLKYLINYDGEKFIDKKLVLFWNIIPFTIPTSCEIHISDKMNFDFYEIISCDPLIDEGFHYSYMIDFTGWEEYTKYFRIKITLNNEIFFSNVLRITFPRNYFLSPHNMLSKLPGYRFYNLNNSSNLGIIMSSYSNELNEVWKNIYFLNNKFLFENFFFFRNFNEFDKLNKWDKIALKRTLSELKNIGNTYVGLKKLFNILVGTNPQIEFDFQKPNIIIGDEIQFFYVIDQGIPPNFTINPPLRSRESMLWNLTIKYSDPREILENKEKEVEKLIREFLCSGYIIKLQQI